MRDDVLVVGGGPAGLYAAQLLAAQGMRVRVLEEHKEIGEPVHCTGVLGAEAFSLPGIRRDAILGSPRAARFHSPAGHCLGYEGPKAEVCIIDRGAFDRNLARAATDAGAVIRTGARVTSLHVERRGVTLTAAIGARTQTISAGLCVLACGARYHFQRALGWGTPPLWLSSAQTELRGVPGDALDIFLRPEAAPTGFAWLVPIVRGAEPHAKVGVMTARAPGRVLARVVDELRAEGRLSEPVRPVIVRPLPLSPLARTYGERVLAIGDAAGLVKPTTGGGIYYSLLSAGWAAEAVTRAFQRGDFSASTLAAYEEAWRARLGGEISIGVWFRRLVARLVPSDLDALTRLAIEDGVMPVVRASARFNWHRELIVQTLRHPGVFRIVLPRLLGTVIPNMTSRIGVH